MTTRKEDISFATLLQQMNGPIVGQKKSKRHLPRGVVMAFLYAHSLILTAYAIYVGAFRLFLCGLSLGKLMTYMLDRWAAHKQAERKMKKELIRKRLQRHRERKELELEGRIGKSRKISKDTKKKMKEMKRMMKLLIGPHKNKKSKKYSRK